MKVWYGRSRSFEQDEGHHRIRAQHANHAPPRDEELRSTNAIVVQARSKIPASPVPVHAKPTEMVRAVSWLRLPSKFIVAGLHHSIDWLRQL